MTQQAPQKTDWMGVIGTATGVVGVSIMVYTTFLSGKGGGDESETAEVPTKPDRWLDPGQSVLLLGDSIAEGIDTPFRNLVMQYGSPIDSLIKRGSTASYWSSRVTEADAGHHLIVLSLGSNDVALFDLNSEAAAMDTLISKLSQRGAYILWFPPPSFREGAFTERQQQFAEMLRVRGVIPLVLLGPQPSTADDPMHLHLTPNGYKTLAAQIFDALTRID